MLVKSKVKFWQLSFLHYFFALFCVHQSNGEFLRISGREFIYNNERVFLSGANYAWLYYGWDFGNSNYQSAGPIMEQWIRDIANAGGNSLRKFSVYINLDK